MALKKKQSGASTTVWDDLDEEEEELDGFGDTFDEGPRDKDELPQPKKESPPRPTLATGGARRRSSRNKIDAVDAAPRPTSATGGARRRSSRNKMDAVDAVDTEQEKKVTSSSVYAAINNSVKHAVDSKLDELTQEQIDNMEHRIAKRRAMIEKRRLALLQDRQSESKRTLETLNNGVKGLESSYAGSSVSMPREYSTGSMATLDELERGRGGSQIAAAPVVARSRQQRSAHPDPQSIIGDPVAMWDAIVQSEATDSVKLNAAKKQLLYIQQEERLVQEKLAAAEKALLRPRKYSETDTVFDDNFENGTIIDDTGEVFGFGAL